MDQPLASFPLVRTSDADEAQAVLSRELSELRFESARDRSRFCFRMNGVHLGQTMVGFNQFSAETEVDAGVIENAVIVSLSVGSPAILDLDGEVVGPDRLAIVSPSRRLRVHRAPESGVILLRAGLDAIKRRFRDLTGMEITTPITFDRSVGLDEEIGSQIRSLLAYLIADADRADTILNNRTLRSGLDDMLLNAFLSLPNNYTDELRDNRAPAIAPSIVRRAEQFLETHATKPITISDVVSTCGCSRRSLFNAFRRHRGYTPLQFLTEARLKAAGDALRNATETDTVTSIALACGFSHLGRFSEAYRRRFGEKPSATMRKAT